MEASESSNIFNPYHSELVRKYFEIKPHKISDIDINGYKIEVKETNSFQKIHNKNYFGYCIGRKDINIHDYVIFINHITNTYFLTDGLVFSSIHPKTYSRISEGVIRKQKIIETNDMNDIKEYLIKNCKNE